MRLSYFVLGILTIVGSLLFWKVKLEVYNVEKKGELVIMEITKLPNSCLYSKGNYYMKVKYQEKIFNKKNPEGYCDKHKVGELIKLRYLEGEETLLFPEEKVKGQFIAISIFILVGIVSIVYGLNPSRKFSSQKIKN